MKSSYVFILFLIVLLACWAFFAKLASHLDLGGRRLPPPAPVEPVDSGAEPKEQEQVEPKEKTLPLESAVADGLIRITTTDRIDTLQFSHVKSSSDSDTDLKIEVAIGTSFKDENDQTLFVAAEDAVVTLPGQKETESANSTIAVFSLGRKNLAAQQQLTPVSAPANETASDNELSPQFLRTAFEAGIVPGQYAVWLRQFDSPVRELPRIKDGEVTPVDENAAARIQPIAISADDGRALSRILTRAGFDPADFKAMRDLQAISVERSVEQQLLSAYKNLQQDSEANVAEWKLPQTGPNPSPVIQEALAVRKLLSLTDESNKSTSPRSVLDNVAKTIEELPAKSQNYPVDDLRKLFVRQITLCLQQAIDAQHFGTFMEVHPLTLDWAEPTAGGSNEIADFAVKLHDTLPAMRAAAMNQLREMADKSVLTRPVVREYRSMFEPDETLEQQFAKFEPVDLDDIPRSRQRDVARQQSLLDLALAEILMEGEMFDQAQFHADRATKRTSKAPGVQSRAQRILRLIQKAQVEKKP